MKTKPFGSRILAGSILLFATVLSCFSAITFQDEDGEIRMSGFSTFKRTLQFDVTKGTQKSILQDVKMLRQTGGGFLKGIAKPKHPISSFSLEYLGDQATDGQRLRVNIDGHSCNVNVYDWELRPIVEFADSQFQGTVSASEKLSEAELREYGAHALAVSYHQALQGNLLGLRHMQADFVRDIGGQSFLPRNDGKTILGPGEEALLGSKEDIRKAAQKVTSIINKMGDFWVLLTDEGVDYTFSCEGTTLVISGEPYYYTWEPSSGKFDGRKGPTSVSGHVLRDEEFNARLRRSWSDIRAMNPVVFKAVSDTAQLAALFRYAKQIDSADWKRFRDEVLKTAKAFPVETPDIMQPNPARN